MPALTPAMGFDEACKAVIEYLRGLIPMGYWSITRYDGTDQVYLAVTDEAYGRVAGDHHAWSDSLCQYAVTGVAPEIAPDAIAVPLYATAGVAQVLDIGAFVGIPLRTAGGDLFGTICGLDPQPRTDALSAHAPLLHLLSSLLAVILEADIARAGEARLLEQSEARAETDQLSGLVNRHGWERYIRLEEERYRRFGTPAR